MKFFKQLILAGLLVTALFATACEKKGGEVVTYNTPQDWVNWGTVLQEFNKETGIKAPNDNKNSGQSLTALISEKDNPLCDMVYLGIAFGDKAEEAEVLEPYKHPYFDSIDPTLKEESGLYSTVHYGAIAILSNTEALGDLPVPKSWNDLLDPKYKGKIGMLNPTSAAVGYSSVVAVNEAMGGSLDDFGPAIEYFKELNKNEVIYPMQTSTAKLMKGEIPILIDADFNGYGLKYNQSGPIEIAIPEEGSVKIPYIIGLVKNAPHKEEGKKLIDYVFSEEGQQLFSEGFVRPINAEAMSSNVEDKFLPKSDYERAISVDWNKMSAVQDSFNELWTKEIQN